MNVARPKNDGGGGGGRGGFGGGRGGGGYGGGGYGGHSHFHLLIWTLKRNDMEVALIHLLSQKIAIVK